VLGSSVASNVGGRIYVGEAKVLGLVGAVLSFILALSGAMAPFISPWMAALLSLADIIAVLLVYLGVSRLSRSVNDTRVKSFYLKFFVLYAVAEIIADVLVSLVAVTPMMLTNIFELPFTSTNVLYTLFPLILVSVIASILIAIGTWYLKKSYDLIKAYTRVEFFGVAGLLYFIGGVLTMIAIGYFVLFIAMIMDIIAWASTPGYIEVKSEATPQPLPQIA